MRVTKHEDLLLMRTALEALRKTKYSRIMRRRAEPEDGREFILLCNLLDRVQESMEKQFKRETSG